MTFAADLATVPKLLRIKCDWVSAKKRGNPQNLIHKTSPVQHQEYYSHVQVPLILTKEFSDIPFFFVCFYDSEMLSCNFEIDSFLFNMPSPALSAWDYKWKCTEIPGEKLFSV